MTAGDQLSNFCDRSRTAWSLRASISARIALDGLAHLGIGRLDRARVHSTLEMAGHFLPLKIHYAMKCRY
jgi:hypothetical protein